MDLPAIDVEVIPEKFEDVKVEGPSFACDLFDTEIVHKIAQALLPGLGSACVDNTTGGLFRSPASVAVDIRKEMVEYLTQRSESFVAESVILEGGPDSEVSDHPYDIISDFVDDFASSKRNLFSRVSGWLLSERREDKIDDFVQEMEVNGFWLIDRRAAIAQTLLKNVDFKNIHHCDMKFNSAEELEGHRPHCGFRSMNCTNEGCSASFCAAYLEKHDLICPFKIIPCEQQCSESLMRREMDRHCITVCPMKLVNCPFYPVGCQSTVPHCMVEQHQLENLDSHLFYILQVAHKDASVKDLKRRVEQLKELSSPSELAEYKTVRSLTSSVKRLEAKLGPLQVSFPKSEENKETSVPVEAVENRETLVPVEAGDKKETSVPEEAAEKKEPLDPEEAVGNREISVPVDAVERETSVPVEAVERETSVPIEAVGRETSVPEEAMENRKTSVPVEAVQEETLVPLEAVGNIESSAPVEAVEEETLVPLEAVGNIESSAPVEAVEETSVEVEAVEKEETSVEVEAVEKEVAQAPVASGN